MWPRLKDFILGQCPNTNEVGTLYMCHYCKASFKNNKLPPRCVLNGLEPVPIPLELLKLELSKYYQTVVRLGTYTGRVPIYNSLKACHGTMFFAVRRMPPQRRQEVQELLSRMLKDDIIQPSSSPWAAPVVLVRKKMVLLTECGPLLRKQWPLNTQSPSYRISNPI